MKEAKYYKILYDGLTEYRHNMADHIYRKWKKAEAKGIELLEFENGIYEAYHAFEIEPFYKLALPEFIAAIQSTLNKIKGEKMPVGKRPERIEISVQEYIANGYEHLNRTKLFMLAEKHGFVGPKEQEKGKSFADFYQRSLKRIERLADEQK